MRFDLTSFIIGCLVGTAGLTFFINLFNGLLSLSK